jgi:hypothetical protein
MHRARRKHDVRVHRGTDPPSTDPSTDPVTGDRGVGGSYYSGLGTTLVAPSVHVTYLDTDTDGKRVRLVAPVGAESIPHRTLS